MLHHARFLAAAAVSLTVAGCSLGDKSESAAKDFLARLPALGIASPAYGKLDGDETAFSLSSFKGRIEAVKADIVAETVTFRGLAYDDTGWRVSSVKFAAPRLSGSGTAPSAKEIELLDAVFPKDPGKQPSVAAVRITDASFGEVRLPALAIAPTDWRDGRPHSAKVTMEAQSSLPSFGAVTAAGGAKTTWKGEILADANGDAVKLDVAQGSYSAEGIGSGSLTGSFAVPASELLTWLAGNSPVPAGSLAVAKLDVSFEDGGLLKSAVAETAAKKRGTNGAALAFILQDIAGVVADWKDEQAKGAVLQSASGFLRGQRVLEFGIAPKEPVKAATILQSLTESVSASDALGLKIASKSAP